MVVLSVKSGCIRKKLLYLGKSDYFGPKVIFIWARVVLFGQKWLYLGKSGSLRGKVVLFGQKWF